MDAPPEKGLYIRVRGQNRDLERRLNRRDGTQSLRSQFTSETSSQASQASQAPSLASSSDVTGSTITTVSTPTATPTVRRYTIKGPDPVFQPQEVSAPVASKSKIPEPRPRRPSVVITRSAKPEMQSGPQIQHVLGGHASQHMPSQAALHQPLHATTVEVIQRHDSIPPTRIIKVNRRGGPPTSWRDNYPSDDTPTPQPDLPPALQPPVQLTPQQRPSLNHTPDAQPVKYLRPRRLSGPTGSTSRDSSSSPHPIPTAAKHTRAAPSIDHAPTPFSSPDPTPAHSFSHSRTRSTSQSQSRPATSTRRREPQDLPPPELVYNQILYYTACPHTSPPSTRPIDIQPSMQPLTPELAQYSSTLRAELDLASRSGREKQVWTIDEICSECDWKARRDDESVVLSKFAKQRYDMEVRIAHLEIQEGQEPDSPDLPVDVDATDDEKSKVELHEQILAFEQDVLELEKEQDQAVMRVWKGYSQRWGPGAVGIIQKGSRSKATHGSRDRTMERAVDGQVVGSSADDVREEGRMKLNWIRPDLPQKKGIREV